MEAEKKPKRLAGYEPEEQTEKLENPFEFDDGKKDGKLKKFLKRRLEREHSEQEEEPEAEHDLEGPEEENMESDMPEDEAGDHAKQMAARQQAARTARAEAVSRLAEKVENQTAKLKDHQKNVQSLENARKNTVDAAYSQYGGEADVKGIEQDYQGLRNVMSPDLEELKETVEEAPDMQAGNKDVILDASDTADGESLEKEATDDLDKAESELKEAMDSRQVAYESDIESSIDGMARPSAAEETAPEAQEAFAEAQADTQEPIWVRCGLPTVALEYDYVKDIEKQAYFEGRPLPEAMTSQSMADGLSTGKSYGLEEYGT